MKKVTIYISPHCPYCHRVQDFVEENNIDVDYRDRDTAKIRNELIQKGGKPQVPYLVDSEQGVEMYESSDIIEHLRANYT